MMHDNEYTCRIYGGCFPGQVYLKTFETQRRLVEIEVIYFNKRCFSVVVCCVRVNFGNGEFAWVLGGREKREIECDMHKGSNRLRQLFDSREEIDPEEESVACTPASRIELM
jgi:hypothetical protein